MKCIVVISCFFFGQLSVSFHGPCCHAPLYCIAVHDCLILIEQINDDDVDDDDPMKYGEIRGGSCRTVLTHGAVLRPNADRTI